MTEHTESPTTEPAGAVGDDTNVASPNGPTATGDPVPGDAAPDRDADGASDQLDVETLVATLEAVTAERDSHLADLQRLTAEFANFRRQATKRQTDTVAHAASGLVEKLLPVLDACDAALQQGATDVMPIHSALLDSLRKEGLEPVDDVDAPFDPERHEAVAHEQGDGAAPTVAEVLRAGYAWKGRVLRPAMVKVRG